VLRRKDERDGVSYPIVVADMSSNILSRRVPVDEHSIIFFGAQKNLGSAGVAVAVVKKVFLPPACGQPAPDVMRKVGLPVPPIMLQYQDIAKNNSLYNTLSIFEYVPPSPTPVSTVYVITNVHSVFIAGQVLKKLLATYPDKVDGQQAVSDKKAQLIYAALEAHPEVYKIVPDKAVRSRMNICFRVVKNGDVDASEKAFLAEATRQGLTGLKGHRSVGGIRASNYNSISLEGAEKLARFIGEFAKA
jgi:phosphoserine aminotransferase